MKFYVCGILIGCSRFIRLDFGPESVVISNIMHLSVIAVLVGVTVTSFDGPVSIAMFFSVIRTMVVFDVIAEMKGVRMVMLQRKTKHSKCLKLIFYEKEFVQ